MPFDIEVRIFLQAHHLAISRILIVLTMRVDSRKEAAPSLFRVVLSMYNSACIPLALFVALDRQESIALQEVFPISVKVLSARRAGD